MNTIRRTELKSHWREVREIDGAAQDQYLERLRGQDPEMALELQSLLAAERRSGDFLEKGFAPGLPQRFGAWRPVRALGQGGMGQVFHAVRAVGDFEQQAAIKTLRAELLGSEAGRRFQRERQILARLDHPHIARLLDGGQDSQQVPYLAMEFVEGQSVDQWAQGRTQREILEVVLQVCDALAYAHRHLIIHCDLKPSNILINTQGQAKLLDFGIARILSPDTSGNTIPHLTPQYASPEQLRNQPLSTATDIYSLGVVLFRLLTGQLPYAATRAPSTDPVALAQQICESPAPALGTKFPRDLEAIVAKSLAKEPGERYASAAALGQDLRHFLAGRSIEARPLSRSQEAWRFAQRYRYAALAALGAFFLLGVTAAWALRERGRAQQLLLESRQMSGALLWEVEKAMRQESPVEARRILLTRTSAYLDRISARDSGNMALAMEQAESYRLLGDALGDKSDGGQQQAYARGLAILEPFRSSPEADFVRAKLLLELNDKAKVVEAWALLESLKPPRSPIAAAAWNDVASHTQERLGVLAVQEGNAVGTREAWMRALAYAEEYRRLAPGDTATSLVSRMQRRLGAAHSLAKDYTKAYAHYQESAKLEEAIYREKPGALNAANFAVSLSEVGFVLLRLDRVEESLAMVDRSLALRRKLFESDAANTYYRFALSNSLVMKADRLHRLKRVEECGPLLAEADRLAAELKDGGLQRATVSAALAAWEKERPGRKAAAHAIAARALSDLERLKSAKQFPPHRQSLYDELQNLSRATQ